MLLERILWCRRTLYRYRGGKSEAVSKIAETHDSGHVAGISFPKMEASDNCGTPVCSAYFENSLSLSIMSNPIQWCSHSRKYVAFLTPSERTVHTYTHSGDWISNPEQDCRYLLKPQFTSLSTVTLLVRTHSCTPWRQRASQTSRPVYRGGYVASLYLPVSQQHEEMSAGIKEGMGGWAQN